MPFGGLLTVALIGAGSSIGSGLLNRKSARQQTAIEPPEYQPLRDLLISTAMKRLESPSTLGPGFLAEGVQNINQGSDLARQSMENRLGASGLLGSGVHGAGLTGLETRRFGDINRLENIDIPRLEREFGNQDVDLATRIFSQRVPGVQLPGSAAGSGISTAAEMLAMLYGRRLIGGGSGGGGNVSGLITGDSPLAG